MRWLLKEWPYAALFTAFFLLILLPLVGSLGCALALIYLQIPLYMIHQFEEHARDRFRIFANKMIAGGQEAFTPMAIFVINSIGIWGVDLAALYLAFYVNLAYGLVAIYLPLVNAVTHIVASLVTRKYNPGLWTSLVLFVPFGVWGLVAVSEAGDVTWRAHVLALLTALGVHALILIHVRLRLLRLAKAA